MLRKESRRFAWNFIASNLMYNWVWGGGGVFVWWKLFLKFLDRLLVSQTVHFRKYLPNNSGILNLDMNYNIWSNVTCKLKIAIWRMILLFSLTTCKLKNTKLQDNKLTLVHFLVSVIEEKYPDLMQFKDDFTSLEKASKGKSMNKWCSVQDLMFGSTV